MWASLTQQGTPAGTWGSSAAFLLPLPLHLLSHPSARPLPLYLPLPPLYLYPSPAEKLGCQMPLLLLIVMMMMMPLRPGCGGKAVVSWRGLEGVLSRHYDFACCKRRAVCQVVLLQAGRSWARQNLDSMKSSEKVETVQRREEPLHWGHTTAGHLASVLWVSKVTKEKNIKQQSNHKGRLLTI